MIEQSISRDASPPQSPRRSRAWLLAIVGLLVTLAGAPIYTLTLGQAFLRSTGLAAFAVMALGCIIGITAARMSRRWWIRVLAGLDVLLVLAGVAFLFAVKLPAGVSTVATGSAAPDVRAPDQNGRIVSLREAYASGPVLLVFYRGHW